MRKHSVPLAQAIKNYLKMLFKSKTDLTTRAKMRHVRQIGTNASKM